MMTTCLETSRHPATKSDDLPALNARRLVELSGYDLGPASTTNLVLAAQAIVSGETMLTSDAAEEWFELQAICQSPCSARNILQRTGLLPADGMPLAPISHRDEQSIATADRMVRRFLLSRSDCSARGEFAALASTTRDLWQMEEDRLLWRASDHAAAEQQLLAAYNDLIASITFEVDGRPYSSNSGRSKNTDPDRTVRHKFRVAKWLALQAYADELNRLFGELVQVRSEGARLLGYQSYFKLAQSLRRRAGAAVNLISAALPRIEHLVIPSLTERKREQARDVGVEQLMFWDESARSSLYDVESISVIWKFAEIVEVLSSAFPGLQDLGDSLQQEGMIDLAERPSRKPGAFCAGLVNCRQPVVACPFDGTPDGLTLLLHELGHAYQRWLGRSASLPDIWAAPSPNGEICAVTFELVALKHLQRAAGKGGNGGVAAWRAAQLGSMVAYAAAINAFEMEVYRQPQMQSSARMKLWLNLETRFLPWRRYGDVPLVSDGGLWLDQRHVFQKPFYFVDYCVASLCALELGAETLPLEVASKAVTQLCTMANTCSCESMLALIAETAGNGGLG